MSAWVRDHTLSESATSGTTISATIVTANVGIGNVLVAWVGFDNTSSVTPTVTGLSRPGGETAAWVMIAAHDSSATAAGGGVRGEMWAIRTTVAWTVGTVVTATLSGTVVSKVALLSEFSGVVVTVRGTAGTSTSASGAPTASTSGTALVVGDLVLGAGTFETYNLPTPDADTTNGSWSTYYHNNGAPFTTDLTGVMALMQFKFVTATGVQTYNPTLAGYDSGAAVVALTPIPNTAPNAPTLTSPATGSTVDRTVTNRFAWTFSDPDAGDSQSKFDLQYRLGAGAWVPITGTTPNNYWDAVGSTFAAGDHEWQVRTYDALGLVGPWSASSFFTAASEPATPTITVPTNGSTVSNTATVTWSAPIQTNYQIRRVADLAGAADTATVYYDSADVIDAPTRSVTVAFPTNNRWEHVQVRVKSAGLWSTWSSIRVFVSFTPPMVPTLTATPNSGTASIAVTITNPAPGGGEPAVAYNDIYVSSPLDQPAIRVATLVPPNSTWTWRRPGAGRLYQLRAVAVGTNGTTSSSDVLYSDTYSDIY